MIYTLLHIAELVIFATYKENNIGPKLSIVSGLSIEQMADCESTYESSPYVKQLSSPCEYG